MPLTQNIPVKPTLNSDFTLDFIVQLALSYCNYDIIS